MEQLSLNDKLCSYLLTLIYQSQRSINMVAGLAGVSQSHLNQVLTKRLPLSQEYIEKVCRVLKVPLEDFYRGALDCQYSYDELQMHNLIHNTDEKQYPAVIQLLEAIQLNIPKK